MSLFTECLQRGGVMLLAGQGAADRDAASVIRLLGQRLLSRGLVLEGWSEAAVSREAVLPTGLALRGGFAAAVPHTSADFVLRSGLALAIVQRPVTFAAMENPAQNLQVQLLFGLALREKHEQIAILQSIAGLLQDEKRLTALIAAGSEEEAEALLGVEK